MQPFVIALLGWTTEVLRIEERRKEDRLKRYLAWPISVLLPTLAGCFSYASPVGPSNHSVTDVKQGEDCTVLLFDIGHHEPTVIEAMKQGGVTKLRSADYRETSFIGIGHKCITAHGE